MKRLILIVVLIAFGVAAFLRLQPAPGTVTVTNAQAVPMGAMFMVTLDMQNVGDATSLTGASSPSGANVTVMNAADPDAPMVIPAGGKGQLAMDGAHLMLRIDEGDFGEGAFLPLTLDFSDGSSVATRVIRKAPSGMQHGMANAIDISPAPTIRILPPDQVSATGFTVGFEIENLSLVRTADDAPHVAGEGHGHIYLNGLKLGRVYDTTFDIGALLPGDYSLRVALNSNDHRPFAVNGAPVENVWNFSIP